MTASVTENLADDLLYGAKPISEFTGLSERQVYYLASTGALPIKKIGSKRGALVARKSELVRALSFEGAA